MSNAIKHQNNDSVNVDAISILPPSKLFPSVRQCNSALATFGDIGEFKKASRLFTQMKKATRLCKFNPSSSSSSTTASASTSDANNSSSASIISNQGLLESHDDRRSSSENNEQQQKENKQQQQHQQQQSTLQTIDLVLDPPKPTLVTYSTLMSRAVSLGKPRVALRLWNLMRNQPNFYANVLSRKRIISPSFEESAELLHKLELEEDAIVPDVIFCNTLMNAYAKLGDHTAARSILNAMLAGVGLSCHEGIPPTDPTVVTYNTLADACKVAGELGAALEVPELMTAHAEAMGDVSLLPDARTYTILISTGEYKEDRYCFQTHSLLYHLIIITWHLYIGTIIVARKKKNDKEARDVRSGGEKDPDMAFALLNRMMNEGITPNGMTYCSLIDVCSRCRRNGKCYWYD